MSQTKRDSFIEATVNVLIGYVVAIASQMAIFPMFGVHIPFTDDLLIGAWFTAISLARSYTLRRWFNARIHRAITGT